MPVYRRFFAILLGVTAALLVEASLLHLAHWQYGRYHQRIREQAERAQAPQARLTGYITALAWLTNQPNPADAGARPGRRLIAVVEHKTGAQLADLGWQPNPPVPTEAPDFSAHKALKVEITGVALDTPPLRGWLRGPVYTTHPQLLARLEPGALTSASMPPTYIAATAVSPSLPHETPLPPPQHNPATHLGYALQWLGMAVVFPLLCWAVTRRKKRRE